MSSAKNELLELQSMLILELERLHSNFTKDPKIRKTEDYIKKRLETLDGVWEKFKDNNTILETEKDRTHEYFTKDVFAAYQDYYKRTRDMIMEYGKPNGRNKQDEKIQVDLEKVQDYLSLQRTNFRAFCRVADNIDIDSIHEKWELEYELKNLQIRWNNIEDLHLKIDNILDGADAEYQDQYIELETLFRSMNKALNKKLSSTVHLHLSTPKIDIPTFSGNYTQWNTFLDLFKEAVHNNPALNKVQKMQHLKGKLRGEAERLIQHLHISSDNYDSAWKILNHRYDNRQVLFTKQMETLLNQPNVQKQTSMELRRLHDTSMECIHGIYNMGIDTSSWDPVFVHLIAKKLDTVTFSDYMEARKSPRDVPDLDEFMEFLEAKFIALEPMNKKEKESVPTCSFKTNFAPKFKQTYNSNKPAFEKRNTSYNKTFHVYSKPAITCPICNKNHGLYQCKIFENMTPDAKLQAISKSNICKNCLYVHKYGCNSEKRCKDCNMPHNTLLHEAITAMNKGASTSNKQNSLQNVHANHVAGDDDEILLATIQMQLRAADGTYTTMRALLDQGSQTTLITENAAQLLGLKRHSIHASVSGIGTSPNKCKGKVELHCKSLFNNYEFTTEALVMTKLADPDYNISRPVDILLDAKVYAEIIMDGLLKSSPDQPIAQQTQMGWILSGSITKSFNCHVVINNIEDISNYWELEDITETKRQLTKDEQFCEDYYTKTTRRLTNGTYEVRLPMKEGFEKQLGQSKPTAVAQYMQLERKLAKNPQLSERYHAFMKEYDAMHHMKICTDKRSTECYLPHHGVLKEDSTTTKLRTVFNASQLTSSGYSLNDLMECGPKLQSDLQLLLLSWRGYKYVYTADCEKMYRMIWLHEEDQHLQKIIWRDQHNILREYQLCTVTYGMKAAPFLAIRTLQQLANDDASLYPLAADVLKNKFYVDDLLHGNNSIEEAKQV
ncbi:uncharacterized protein LOC113233481 [Hyposmocoma kahamanoa]|uniref:uncharacterized protein LOC113233481 n=2 Tax=Hyposmocoma kahamanoa TaxID=1477025 RepID=UPI000E6D9AC5|nr:uncharacterized protein LOC113233481 [Hyposmocoma kahamanoa]